MVFQNKSAVLAILVAPHDQGWKKNDNDAIVHTGRIIDRFFEKALDQYYSQLSEAGRQLYTIPKKDQTQIINGKTN